jgi:Na+/melibiose symporter-like transporter
MEGSDLFVSLAEIAGVFVGFGALIAVRSGSPAETEAVSSIRWVVSSGVWVVIVALVPVIASQFAGAGHELWIWCGVLALGLLVLLMLAIGRTPENRTDVATTLAEVPRARIIVVMGLTFWLPTTALVLALIALFLDLAPGQDRALYLTAVAFGLVQAALQMLVMVFWQRSPSASVRDERAVTGGAHA